MDKVHWLFVFEFGGAFALIGLLGWWQLRSLKKLDEEDAHRDRED